MANYFSKLMDDFAQKIAERIGGNLNSGYKTLGAYYQGKHRPQLKPTIGGQDDNIIQNFVGLAIDRSVSRLFRGGVKWKLPEGAEAQAEYLNAVWDVNKQQILLYQLGLHGSVYGTAYLKISPDGLIDPYTNQPYPRLIAVDPEIIRFETMHDNKDEVEKYLIEYTYSKDDKVISFREITRRANSDDYETEQASDTWIVEQWEQVNGMPWQMVNKTDWPYNFPPIIHWKNLPSLQSQYGDSDIDDAINVQDKSNLVVSNTGKIIKHYAHPNTIGTGFTADGMKVFDNGVGKFHTIQSDAAKVYNLEMQSDLSSSRLFGLDLRQSIFDVSREIDLSSITDKIGSLTNFGLHILYSDALDKNDTKRQLYGDALLELNRRLLVLGGYEGEASRPGSILWGEPLYTNVLEELQADQLALDMGLVDKRTVYARYEQRYGADWETIQQNMAEIATTENQNSADIGTLLLRNFTQGR